jgi:hypothetical protein
MFGFLEDWLLLHFVMLAAVVTMGLSRKYSAPAASFSTRARIAVVILFVCQVVNFAMAASVFGPIVWFIFSLIVSALFFWMVYHSNLD